MKYYQKMLASASILLIPLSSYAQDALPSKAIELPPRPELSILEKIAKEKERVGKKAFELFLKCDGKNGNVDFSYDEENADYYMIDSRGKCIYIFSEGGYN